MGRGGDLRLTDGSRLLIPISLKVARARVWLLGTKWATGDNCGDCGQAVSRVAPLWLEPNCEDARSWNLESFSALANVS